MYQKITLVGRLGQDPRMSYTSAGTAVTTLNVATDRSWVDKATGQKQHDTTWFKVAVWGGQAEPCNQYLAKGRMVMVEGEMQAPKIYKTQNGEAGCNLEVRASRVVFLGGTNNSPATDDFISDLGDEEIPF